MPGRGYRGALVGSDVAASGTNGVTPWSLVAAPGLWGKPPETLKEVSSAVEQSTVPGERDSVKRSPVFLRVAI